MALSPTKKKKIRANMAAYCQAAEANEVNWHYTQQRPFAYTDNPKGRHIAKDCSGYVGNVFWNAFHDTQIWISDPLNQRYTGWGYTGTLEDYLRKYGKRVIEANGYLVGDIARWGQGSHAHTAVCRKDGSASTAIFSSFGREEGPNPVKLYYRDDLVGVWRHPALL